MPASLRASVYWRLGPDGDALNAPFAIISLKPLYLLLLQVKTDTQLVSNAVYPRTACSPAVVAGIDFGVACSPSASIIDSLWHTRKTTRSYYFEWMLGYSNYVGYWCRTHAQKAVLRILRTDQVLVDMEMP